MSRVEAGAGRFPQVSGITYTYDPTAESGDRIVDATAGGDPIDPDATYTLATNVSSPAAATATYARDATVLVSSNEGALLSDLIINTIEERGRNRRPRSGRITRLSDASRSDRLPAVAVPVLTRGHADARVGVAEFLDVDGSTVSPVSTSSEVTCPSARTNSSLASSMSVHRTPRERVCWARGHPAASLSRESR